VEALAAIGAKSREYQAPALDEGLQAFMAKRKETLPDSVS